LKSNDLLVDSGMGEPETSLMQIEVLPATTEQEPVLANLLEMYAHDFSEFSDLKIGVDGRFGALVAWAGATVIDDGHRGLLSNTLGYRRSTEIYPTPTLG
jgi:hypothetical protein